MRTHPVRAWASAAIFLITTSVFGQADVAGEWRVEFSTPTGPVNFTMYISQSGARLTGHLLNENGEFPMTGTVDGNQVKIVWQLPDVSSILDITFLGRADGDRITGTVRIEKVGEGPLVANRTSR